ncbi:MAG: acetoacetyl-CoA reductase [Candidatus Paracaedibacteraceae bacterium]|nr:acetoacetyl-CoA reductase [Candidatus Paracaedibacteraceae bacterium]
MSQLALVTGGTRGIGAAISRELTHKGYRVIASYASNKEAARLFSAETGIQTIAFDIADENACKTAINYIETEHGSISMLVHNAGITADSTLEKMASDQWHRVIRTNLNSCFYLTQAVLDGMRAQNFGRLIYLSSVNGLKGQRGQCNYAAAKAAIIGFAKSIALEVANKGITANVIAPGYIDTEMVRAVPKPVLEKIIGTIPVGRLGTAEEIAHCVSFLADKHAGFITGSTLSANGGMY